MICLYLTQTCPQRYIIFTNNCISFIYGMAYSESDLFKKHKSFQTGLD